MDKLSERSCKDLRELRDEIRDAKKSAGLITGDVERNLFDADEEVASRLMRVLGDHVKEDMDATEETIVDLLDDLCEEGSRDINPAVEQMGR